MSFHGNQLEDNCAKLLIAMQAITIERRKYDNIGGCDIESIEQQIHAVGNDVVKIGIELQKWNG